MPTGDAVRTKRNDSSRGALRRTIGDRWATVWSLLPAAVDPANPDGIHDMRVASRRLRAAMDIGQHMYDPAWFKPLHVAARDLTRTLGDVRDLEVLMEHLEQDRDNADGVEREAIDHLLAGVRKHHEAAFALSVGELAALLQSAVPKSTARHFPVTPDKEGGGR